MAKINVYYKDISWFRCNLKVLNEVISAVILGEGKIQGELSFVFCSDEFLLGINREFLGHDYYTDVIAFDESSDNILGGEIYISLERVKENSLDFRVSFDNELARVLIHSVLHLSGYRDSTEYEKLVMRQKEDFYLVQFEELELGYVSGL